MRSTHLCLLMLGLMALVRGGPVQSSLQDIVNQQNRRIMVDRAPENLARYAVIAPGEDPDDTDDVDSPGEDDGNSSDPDDQPDPDTNGPESDNEGNDTDDDNGGNDTDDDNDSN